VFARPVQGSETSADLEVRWIRIAPGSEISNHTHEGCAETFFVLAGNGSFEMEGTSVPCHLGSCGYAAPGSVHGVKNTGHEDLHLLAIFTPPLNR
jgi:mannose-6-phosphate isomerase-like protein (cupin superfamily)